MRLRHIALVPALLAAFCALGCGRENWQKPEEVVEALGIQSGDRVADLGSGSGYFAWLLAEEVGSEGRLYCVDVDEEALAKLEASARDRRLNQVEAVLCAPDDPQLPEQVDLVFACNAYHHLEDHVSYFAGLKRYLLPGARVAIVEYDGGSALRRRTGHFTARDEILEEMTGAGYQLAESFDFLPKQSFLIFIAAPAP